jgi:glycolate oxidase iron-sulfur subunit
VKTSITQAILQTHQGIEANRILRNCVHCGFCNATCPTYQLTGDELDGPRGRIYLIKQVLEGKRAGSLTQSHLDRCLTCRNCESTCPSGVDYGELLDIGRKMVSEQTRRSIRDRFRRFVVRKFFLTRPLFNAAITTAQSIRTFLPGAIKQKVPAKPETLLDWPTTEHQRKIILLPGCVQPALQPNIDRAAAIVLDRLGIQTLRIPRTGCCGGISHHLDAYAEAQASIKSNIDRWWPYVHNNQIEAIISTATGCEVTIKEYGRMLVDDQAYRHKAARISELSKDLSEYVADQGQQPSLTTALRPDQKVAFHPPCTLQHGQQIRGKVESLLQASGRQLVSFQESHLCCGSAGTYSILQKTMAEQLRDRKVQHIESAQPDVIATANVGCLLHLQSGTHIPVKHWIEMLV